MKNRRRNFPETGIREGWGGCPRLVPMVDLRGNLYTERDAKELKGNDTSAPPQKNYQVKSSG